LVFDTLDRPFERESPHTRARASPSSSPAGRRITFLRRRLGFGRANGSKRSKKWGKRTGEQTVRKAAQACDRKKILTGCGWWVKGGGLWDFRVH
jgi:hypothetical protein